MPVLDWFSSSAARLQREATDVGHAASYLRQLVRGNRRVKPSARSTPVSVQPTPASVDHPPVLLLHGYFATRGSLHLLEMRLRNRGHVVFSYRLGPLHTGGIETSAALVARKVESLCAKTGLPRIDVVGHSLGGLVGVSYVKRHGGGDRVRRLVLLGAPAAGTWTALAGLVTTPLGRGGLDLLPGSDGLRQLRDLPFPPGVDAISVAGARDFIAPPDSTLLAGARSIVLPTSHAGLLVDALVADRVSDILSLPSPPRATSPFGKDQRQGATHVGIETGGGSDSGE